MVQSFIKWFIQHQHELEVRTRSAQSVNPVVPKVTVRNDGIVDHFKKQTSIDSVNQSTSTIADYEDQLDRQSKTLICTIHKAYKETIEVTIFINHPFHFLVISRIESSHLSNE